MPDKKHQPNSYNKNDYLATLKENSNSENLMQAAITLQTRAASFGFDWPNIEPIFAKLDEEINELKYEVEQSNLSDTVANESHKRLEDELGDVLFCCMNLARSLNVDPAKALQSTNDKFQSRFGFIEYHLSQQGKKMQDLSLEELDKIWDMAKAKGL